MRWAVAALGIAVAIASGATPTAAGMLRACDGRVRHVTCHWAGGDRPLDLDVPPDEHLGYGLPSVVTTERGRIHVVVGSCEITCNADPPPR